MVGTITLRDDCSIGDQLLALRREVAFDGAVLDAFHATSDRQWVRDKVFEVIASCSDLRYDVTILDKRKTISKYRRAPIQFYKLAWYLHLKYVASEIAGLDDELFVAASALSISRKKKAVREAIENVVVQVAPSLRVVTAFQPTASDPCLQIADYCTWAMQRKYEQFRDDRSYELIRHLIHSEFQPFSTTKELKY